MRDAIAEGSARVPRAVVGVPPGTSPDDNIVQKPCTSHAFYRRDTEKSTRARCYRREPFPNDRARVEYLFALYERLTPLVPAAKSKRTRKPTH